MNKPDLINAISEKTNLEKNMVEKALQGFEDVIIEQLKAGKEVTLTGFGTFSAKFRHARKGVNPQRPSESINVPAVTVPKFKAGKTLKDSLKDAHTSVSSEPVAEETKPLPQAEEVSPSNENSSEPLG